VQLGEKLDPVTSSSQEDNFSPLPHMKFAWSQHNQYRCNEIEWNVGVVSDDQHIICGSNCQVSARLPTEARQQSRVTFCCDTNISLFLRPELVDNATKCTGVEELRHRLFNGKFIANRCLSRGRWKYIYFCPWLYSYKSLCPNIFCLFYPERSWWWALWPRIWLWYISAITIQD
jgi:hypothetical protein